MNQKNMYLKILLNILPNCLTKHTLSPSPSDYNGSIREKKYPKIIVILISM